MPFIPHTESDVRAMLDVIGAPSIDALFDEIPTELRCAALDGVPEALPEMAITRLMHARAAQDGAALNFIGAGAYEHHIPAAVWEITTRGEFYSAYTPYQAEASQGTLQVLYEFQTMMTALTGMQVSNASMYDGATALAESLLMALRANRKNKDGLVLLPQALNPFYAEVVAATTPAQGVQVQTVAFDRARGTTALDALKAFEGQAPTAVVIQQPNFFGQLEDVDAITDWAHAQGAMVIAVVNPIALALLKPPGEWGAKGADIVCGDGQPLGAPLSSGGPYFGFMTTQMAYVREMPGRIIGRTVDLDGRPGFTLTLQAREQHIRRAKAKSNICTNQGLLVTAATIHMAILGAQGLEQVASASIANTRALVAALCSIPGVARAFDGAGFHEAVITLPRPVAPVLEALAARGVLGGFDLSEHFGELGNALLVCATETKTPDDITTYRNALAALLGA
ncbi:aminomethyl-transferring glycine dehydrogenase subunit GcvPA [Sinimarinibacterium sp. NLF-5-8]|uniref:aminomethyl-transferring glycine dehydrogenase subunit GcvPA n=1 Tax=Sinimarinibacterium sp. NLF-5-8 TaxID=2698684 RepID=UPI00137B9DE2|nr:aminomethyl-transferring glycine dehydrogenase subunit GcvPA [Sinimarinibacterium sp. NLF-5-8]QHS10118.1 aminomethyl-transferring glycine dehydrogenase subunit GcvPA [Sinimarinibacterium sp. NLF-5-8]